MLGCVVAAVALTSRFVHGGYGVLELAGFAAFTTCLAVAVSTKGRIRSVSKYAGLASALTLVSLLVAPTVVMGYLPGALPREYDLSFPNCLNHSLEDYMRAVENSSAFHLFLLEHGDAHLNHFMLLSRGDPQAPPLILLTYFSSDGFTIMFSTRPFNNDFVVKIHESQVYSSEQLSDMGLNLYFQDRLRTISGAGFQTLYQRLLETYTNMVTKSSGEGYASPSNVVSRPDGVDINVILDYGAREISFEISASSKVHGRLFNGQVDPFGNIMRFTTFYPAKIELKNGLL